MNHFYPGPHQVRIYALEQAASGEPLLLMPLRLCYVDYSAFGARTLGSISHPENYATVALMFAPAATDQEALLTHLLRHFRNGSGDSSEPRADVLRLWPVDIGSQSGQMLRRALRKAGFWTQTYANSYNRYEDTVGLSYEEYFSRRSANLRYSVRRRQRALEKSGRLELALYREPAGLDDAIADYTSVSLGSWKEAESMVSDDMIALIRLTAANGCLRLGILRFDGVPAAAQFWIVAGGVAHCSRLAYHDDFKQLAVGVVLTNFMITYVLDQDHVNRIDFGYGEEDYKGGWMKDARDYYGFLAFNTATRAGLRHGLKNIFGRPVKRAIKAVLRWLHLRNPEPAAPGRGRSGSASGAVDR
jgi:CelD/BcsL family acetyltransferase involved in cellulose biosynthesis